MLPLRAEPRGKCVLCQKKIESLVAYVMFGACVEDDYLTDGSEVFMRIGVHTADPDGRGNKDVEVVRIESDSQVDLPFCSTGCLRAFLNSIVDQLESE